MWHKDKKWAHTVGKSGINRFVGCRVVINLQFVKKKKKKKGNCTTWEETALPESKLHYLRCIIRRSAVKWGMPVQWNVI